MSKIPYSGKSQQARQGQVPQNVSADPLAPAENLPAENPLLEDPDALAARLAESEDFVRDNRNVLLGILAAVVLSVCFTWKDLLGIGGEGGFQFIQKYTGFISPGILAVFLLGMFWKRTTATAGIVGILAGFALSVFFNNYAPAVLT